MDSDPPPPPPPPHGQNPRPPGGSGLPDGNYDIFIIPPHSAGSGFLYLPSLQGHRNSFLAGIAVALFAVGIYVLAFPVLKQWIGVVMTGGGGLGVVLLIIAVGVGAWAWGKTQAENDAGARAGGHGGSGSSGRPGTSGQRQQGPQSGGPRPNHHSPPPPHGEPGTGPQPRPSPNADAWEKAREDTRKREEERKRTEELKRKREEAQKAREEAERAAKEKAEKEKWEQARAREKETREREARERIARERLAREKEAREAKEKAEKEKAVWEKAKQAIKEKAEKEKAEKEKAQKEKAQKEKADKEKADKEKADKEKADKAKAAASERSCPAKPATPSRNYEKPSAKSQAGTESYSYRPYDTPKAATTYKSSASSTSGLSESSYAPSMSTARTTPPPSQRGRYSTNDPDKIQIKAVYLFSDSFPTKPISQLVSGQGPVTDGLILRIKTEGLFIDDDIRRVPQREWDVKAWTLKLVEDGMTKTHAAGALHIFRATTRDAENKKYTFVLDESEGYKVAIGLGKLRKGSQVRSLGMNGLKEAEVKGILMSLGWM